MFYFLSPSEHRHEGTPTKDEGPVRKSWAPAHGFLCGVSRGPSAGLLLLLPGDCSMGRDDKEIRLSALASAHRQFPATAATATLSELDFIHVFLPSSNCHLSCSYHCPSHSSLLNIQGHQ